MRALLSFLGRLETRAGMLRIESSKKEKEGTEALSTRLLRISGMKYYCSLQAMVLDVSLTDSAEENPKKGLCKNSNLHYFIS